MSRFVLAETAIQDLNAIWDYIALDNETAADHFMDELFKQFALLAEHPGSGRSRFGLDDMPLLFWPVKRYPVVYRRHVDHVEVAAVIHGARDVPEVMRLRFE